MSVTAVYISQLTVTEVVGNVPFVNPSEASITHDQLNKSVTMNASSTVVASVVVAENYALITGAKTIDLTTLTGTNGAAVDATGLKIKAIKIVNPLGNSAMTVKAGASNPYLLFGAAWSIILAAEQEVTAYLANGAPAVGSGAKTIDLAGTGSQVVKIIAVFG